MKKLEVKGVDFVLDSIGYDTYAQSLTVLKKGATIISLPTPLSERQKEDASKKEINAYRITVNSNGNDMKLIADLLKEGFIKSHVSKTFAFENMKEAHKQIETERTCGKVVVLVN